MFRRLVLLALLFGLELAAITLWLDNARLAAQPGIVGFVGNRGSWILRVIVGFAAVFFTFAWLKRQRSGNTTEYPVNWWYLAGHLGLITAFLLLSSRLYGDRPSAPLAVAWLVTGTAAVVLGAVSFIHPAIWRQLGRRTGYLWVWALAVVVPACFAGESLRALWPWAASLTFRIARQLLRPFVPVIVSNPATMNLGTPRFSVDIAPQCSGLEGVGLMLAFGVLWLVLFRRECRFPRALLLLPAGVLVAFFLNSVRIALLILIGNAGAEAIALGGFHSQAGWIAFNLVALGFSFAAVRIPWIGVNPPAPEAAASFENPVAPWIFPFVSILAAGMIAHALTSDFEWLYPLRLLAALAAFAVFSRSYRKLDWRVDWEGPAMGALVFFIWIAIDRFASATPEAMPPALAAASGPARGFWVAARACAAIITVPLAEELAFRGFLYRRIVSPDFASVSFRRFSPAALAVSSLAFGLLHGDRWFAGTVAGLLYGVVMLRKGRIGNAVVAHATTNALIAVDVLLFQHWHLW